MPIIVYEKRACTTCRKLATLLADQGVDFERVEYHVEGLTTDELHVLVEKVGGQAHALLRMREPGARELAEADDEAVIAAMVANPALLQRPIVVNGARALLARPVERVLEIL